MVSAVKKNKIKQPDKSESELSKTLLSRKKSLVIKSSLCDRALITIDQEEMKEEV